MPSRGLCAAAWLLVSTTASCAADTSDAQPYTTPISPITDLSSGATCPAASPLTYDNFGAMFFASYCLQCHSLSIPVGPMRQAPPDRNFDDLPHVRMLAHQIDQQAAAGPSGVHEVMPPLDPKPTLPQRMQLGEWLACGAP